MEKAYELVRLLEKDFDLESIIAREEPGMGRSLMEMLKEELSRCNYAFALLTQDDFVKDDGEAYPQARPNVYLEIGMLLQILGKDRVCLLTQDSVQLPSNLGGFKRHRFVHDVAEVGTMIRRELIAAGLIS